MSKHTALDVSKWFLSYNRIKMWDEGGELISNLKLQKLLYYAQGCYLALTDSALFDDNIVAWQHGPVVETVYHYFKANGSNGIPFDEDFDSAQFTEQENNVLIEVYDVFGQFSAWKLRNMTHDETPWKSTKPNEIIPIDIIKDYFKKEYLA